MRSNWKKRSKRVAAMLLGGVMILSMAGCGKGNKGIVNEMDKNHVFREEILSTIINNEQTDLGDVNEMFYSNGRLYVVKTLYVPAPENGEEDISDEPANDDVLIMPRDTTEEELVAEPAIAQEAADNTDIIVEGVGGVQVDNEVDFVGDGITVDDDIMVDDEEIADWEPIEYDYMQYTIISCNLDGSDVKTVELPRFEQDGWYSSYCADTEGNIYVVRDSYDEIITEEGYSEYQETYSIIAIDAEGNLLWETNISSLSEEGEYFYLSTIRPLPSGELMALTSAGLSIIDKDGNAEVVDSAIEESFNSMYVKDNGDIILSLYGENGEEYYKYDLATNTLSDKYTLPGTSWQYNGIYAGNEEYDFYVIDNSSLGGVNLGDTEVTEIMDFIDSDLLVSYFRTVVPISSEEFLISYYDQVTYEPVFSRMVKVDPSDVKEKAVLTLGCYYLDTEIKRQIIDFNKTSPDYRISMTDYSIYDSYENDSYVSGITQLNNDITSGKVPDIMIINGQLPVDTYASKGLLEDLNKYFESDENINRADYMENILDAFESNGKLYQIPTSFSVQTVVGKVSDVGTGQGWTLDELLEVYRQKPEGTSIFRETTRDSIWYTAMSLCSDQFINWETGECYFDSSAFIDFLEFVELFPETINYDEIYGENFDWNEYEQQYRTGEVMLSIEYLSELNRFSQLRQTTFGEDVNFIGFPTENGNGSSISYNNSFAISAKSANKEGAWDFIKYFLLPEYQDNVSYYFPLLLSSYDRLIEEAKSRPYWTDENGEKVEFDQTYYLGDIMMTVEPSTDEDIEYVMNFLKSLSQIYRYNEDLNNIVVEESQAYFSGQKSAEEVAKIIQSRASIYVSENM